MSDNNDLPSECCGHCRFFLLEPASRGKLGYCRRNPPIVILVGMTQASAILADPNNAPMQPVFNSAFPQLMLNGWCGEFKRQLDS